MTGRDSWKKCKRTQNGVQISKYWSFDHKSHHRSANLDCDIKFDRCFRRTPIAIDGPTGPLKPLGSCSLDTCEASTPTSKLILLGTDPAPEARIHHESEECAVFMLMSCMGGNVKASCIRKSQMSSWVGRSMIRMQSWSSDQLLMLTLKAFTLMGLLMGL